MSSWFSKLQAVGKALMLPVAVLPAAALLLRLGAPDVFDIPFITQAGGAVFNNLALIFAVGIAVGLAKDNNGAAGLAGVIGYLVLTEALKAIDKDLNMGVLAGVIVGIISGILYNKFYNSDVLPPLSLSLRRGGFLFDTTFVVSISKLSPCIPRFFIFYFILRLFSCLHFLYLSLHLCLYHALLYNLGISIVL